MLRLGLAGVVVLILASLGLIMPEALEAQTVDGETPAQETICSPLVDATPGLYGLCVSYCEAQDCPAGEPGNLDMNCTRSSPLVLANYRRLMQPGDPDMPCVRQGCPCFDEDDLLAISEPLTQIDPFCFITVSRDAPTPDADIIYNEVDAIVRLRPQGPFDIAAVATLPVNPRRFPEVCVYTNADTATSTAQAITPEQVAECQAQIFEFADDFLGGCFDIRPGQQ